VSSDLSIKSGDILLITDCKSAEIFAVLAMDKNKILSRQSLKKRYQFYTEIHQVEENNYFIGLTQRRDDRGQPVRALYRKALHEKLELVEGIDEMTVAYDLSEEGIILGAAIKIVAASQNNFPLKKTQYTYAGIYEN
jgi:hypothetical protein